VIERLETPDLAAAWCADRRAAVQTLGFVPTMGALHEGHLGLVRRAADENERVCVSVFVNPLQFNDPRDFERYPRDFTADADLLAANGCDMVFTGTLAEFFAGSEGDMERVARRDPGPAAASLEGEHRPGHFEGVATIVGRLFEVVEPDRAYFGLKDYQQSLVVTDVARAMAHAMNREIEVIACPTAREASGLARSSRNELLSAAQRTEAAAIHRALLAARDAWHAESVRDAAVLAARMRAVLEPTSLVVEYAELRDPEAWTAVQPAGPMERAVALVAARAGEVRLIDNVRLDGAARV
jgi:pantoate--beta-alanine ligase